MVEDLSIQDGKKISLTSEKGKTYIFDKKTFNESIEKKKKKKAHIHIEIDWDQKKKWYDIINKEEDIKNLKSLVTEGVENYIDGLSPVEQRFASIPGIRISKMIEDIIDKIVKKQHKDIKKVAKIFISHDISNKVTIEELLDKIEDLTRKETKIKLERDTYLEILSQKYKLLTH